jgi:capsular exopolysaccharide synthesis family protein
MQPNDDNKDRGGQPPAEVPAAAGQRGARPPAVLNAAPTAAVLLRCLRRRLVVAGALGLLLGGLGGAGGWFFAPPPKHTVRTLLRVPPGSPFLLRTAEPVPDLGSHQRTQAAMVRSRLVLNSALRDPEVKGLALVAGKIEPVAWLEKQVQVDFSVAPEVMRISLAGVNTEDLEVLVNAIRQAYLQEVVDKERGARRERMAYLGELIQKYENELKASRDTQRNIEEQLGAKTAEVRGQMLASLQRQLSMIERELFTAKSQERRARQELKLAQAREEKFADYKVPEPDVDEALAKNPEVRTLEAEVRGIESLAERTADRAALGNQDQKVLQYRRQIARKQQAINDLKGRLRSDVVKRLRERARMDLQATISQLQVRIVSSKEMQETLGPEVEYLSKRLAELGKKGVRLDSFREDVSHLEDLTKRFKQEHEALKVELQAPSKVAVLEEATVTRVNVEARKWMMTAGAALAALCFGLFGVSWLEYRARRVDTVEEVVLGLGLRLVGTVPPVPRRGASGKQPPGQDAARQGLTESVDAARTMLLHLARTRSLKTVMVTSAVAGEGKTSLSCHLAASLARAGLRTLLIDADVRNPTVHKLFGIKGEAGFAEALCGKADTASSVRATSVPGLSLLPAGRWSEQVTLALNQGGVQRLLEPLRREYGIIVIDSSPVLPVADALLVGQQVDGVLLSVLCQVSRLHNLYAAWQRVEELGIATLGVVINGVQGSLYGAIYKYPYPRKAPAQT